VKFKYDPFGRRIQRRVSTTQNGQNVVKTYIYIYDREDVIIGRLSETIGGGAPTVTKKKYVHGPGVDEPLAVAKGGGVYYYHADGLGSDDFEHNPVALLWGGWQEKLRTGCAQENWTYGIALSRVLDALGIDLVSSI